jgi:uncharacterized membrane protein
MEFVAALDPKIAKKSLDELIQLKYQENELVKDIVAALYNVMDLEILAVLVTRLLRQDLNRLVNGMGPVELWDEG